MRHRSIVTICALSIAFSSAVLAQETREQQFSGDWLERAQKLYDKHNYAEAARIAERVVQDPAARNSEWLAGALYNLACFQAMAGHKEQALTSFASAVDLGYDHTAASILADNDLTSLHQEPAFLASLDLLKKRKARWSGDSLASAYVPVLSENERIAGLSKFWSEARFAFPFFDRIPDLNWDRLYLDYLPRVRTATSTADYYRLLMRFAAALQDGHTNVYPPDAIADDLGSRPALRTALVENSVIITSVADPSLELQYIRPGLRVLKIDGRESREYAQSEITPYVSSSTPQDRDVRTYTYSLLSGPASRPVRLLLEDETGKTFEVSVPRIGSNSEVKVTKTPGARFRLLPDNIAYLAVDEFEDDEGAKLLIQHFAEAQGSRGLIIDVRANGGGSSDYGYQILAMLTDKPLATSRWRTLDYRPAFRAWGGAPAWFESGASSFPPDKIHQLKEPVVVLTSARTFSAAEDFAVAFDAMHRGLIVGQATGGSTGQPLFFKLPGGGSARICTKDDSYPDGMTFEGKGVMPQVVVKPTIADIRTERDAVLETAVRTLTGLSAKGSSTSK